MAKKSASKPAARDLDEWVEEVVASLKKAGSKKVKDAMARYAIPMDRRVRGFRRRDEAHGESAWTEPRSRGRALETGHYEARMLATFVDDPAEVTPEQMDRWAKDFDNWAICDTATFALFDRTPHAWKKVKQWAAKKDEFIGGRRSR